MIWLNEHCWSNVIAWWLLMLAGTKDTSNDEQTGWLFDTLLVSTRKKSWSRYWVERRWFEWMSVAGSTWWLARVTDDDQIESFICYQLTDEFVTCSFVGWLTECVGFMVKKDTLIESEPNIMWIDWFGLWHRDDEIYRQISPLWINEMVCACPSTITWSWQAKTVMYPSKSQPVDEIAMNNR